MKSRRSFTLLPKLARVSLSIFCFRLETPILIAGHILFNISYSIVGPSLLMIPPAYVHKYPPRLSLSFLREEFLIELLISLDIIYELTLPYKCFTYCALLDKFFRASKTKAFVRTWFLTFPMPSSPKYTCYLWFIAAIWILSTELNMLFAPGPVSTMNLRLSRPYFLARLIMWSIIYL